MELTRTAKNYINIDKNDKRELKWIVRMGNFYGFGKILKRKIMAKSDKKFTAILNKEGKFKIIDDVTYFEIPTTFSTISLGEYIITNNENEFEDIFKYHEKIAEVIVGRKKENEKLFNDRESFGEIIKRDPRKARKLYPVYKNNLLKDVSPENIQTYAKNFKIDIVLDKETGKISLTNTDIWKLLSLLCEDYYRGTFSNLELRAEHKIYIY